MSEIPMPGDYGQSQPPQPAQKGFCSSVCEWSCKGLAICCIVIVVIFLIFFTIVLNSFPFSIFY